MRYALMREMDISNGKGIGVSLFVQGCPIHCKGCFNQDIWDFDGGKEWTKEAKCTFLDLINKPYVKRVSILGGEPLAMPNLIDLIILIRDIRLNFPNKDIWLYTGRTLSMNDFRIPEECHSTYSTILRNCDVIVDGPYIEEQRDLTLAFRGSKNQRLIDVKETLKQGQIITIQN